MTITTIAFDGDDTLWHHDNFFRNAIERFHEIMNELGDFPDAREQIDTQHIKDLAVWGYGVKGLLLSMIELAIRMTDGKISGTDIQRIFDVGKQTHMHPVTLLEGVAETIGKLHDRYQLILITKGDLIAQEMKIHKSGLTPFFDGVEIISEKDTATYKKIMARYDAEPGEFIMIGNTLRSDILPVVQLGAQAIHIPYSSSWHYEVASVTDLDKQKYVMLKSMKDVPALLDRLEKSGQDQLSAAYQIV
jgi:putative hydrolase of the HAD superfamily